MLEPEVLRAADVYAWLGCQKLTAAQLGCNQSTVSRRAREADRLASLGAAWGGEDFLGLERRVHQCWRFSKATDLRVHAYRWINPTLRPRLPDSWVLNPPEVSVTRAAPTGLLADRVIDALLAPWPEVADLDPAQFVRVPLYSTPLLLLAPRSSLLSLESALKERDVCEASRLETLDFVPALALGCSRRLDAELFRQTGPGGVAAAGSADGRAAPRFWGTPLTPLVRPDLVPIDYRTSLSYSEVLVCRREWLEHAEVLRLLEAIRRALAQLPIEAVEGEWLEVA